MTWVNDAGEVFKNPLYYDNKMIFNPPAETLTAAGYHVFVPPADQQPEPVYHFSKYKVKQMLGPEAWAEKRAELEAADLYEDLLLADCLATDDPIFGPIWENLTDEERRLLLTYCQF